MKKAMTKNYVKATNGRAHKTPAEEIYKLFIAVGWVGQRRKSVILKRLPYFDKGPGIVK